MITAVLRVRQLFFAVVSQRGRTLYTSRVHAALLIFAAIFLWVCGSSVSRAADDASSISSIQTAALPSLPEGITPSGLVTVGGRPVAFGSARLWVLNTDRRGWTGSDASLPHGYSIARAAANDGAQAFLLLRDQQTNEIARVARLSFDGNALAVHELPPLPVAFSQAFAASHDQTLYIAGVDATGAPRLLQLVPATHTARWTEHRGWPGGGEPTSLVVQSSALYLTLQQPGQSAQRLTRWSGQAGWKEARATPAPVVSGSGRAIGQAHILYLMREARGSSSLMSFHTISGAWAALPYRTAANVLAVAPWTDGVLIAGEEAGRVRFEAAMLESQKRLLTWFDWSVIVIYLAAMVGMGLYFHFRDKQGSAAEFFVGSRSIPVWAAGVSLYATNTSSISYIAIPAKSFETNWQYLSNNLVTVLGLMFVATWIVPLLRRLDLVSVFTYLEMRFHPAIRVLASALCILMQVGGRMSVVLFLPALAIAAITGLSVTWSITLMGVCTIVYTALGGMRAVIWTDFMQVFVMFGGALFAIFFILETVGSGEAYQAVVADDKMKLVDFSFDLTQATIWGFVVLTLLDVVLTFPKDQVLMQRALATKSDRSAGRSIWIFAAMTIPGGFIFYGIGTALYAYYQARPERLDPLLPIDATFPLFIAAELPSGATGLIIAGIFAAAMSTLSSTINSVATLLTVDFYGRIVRNPTQEKSLRFAEWMSVVIGLVGIGLALILSRYDIRSMLDTTIELTGLLGGGFAGAYTLGMFTKRANSAGVFIGVACAMVVTLIAWSMNLVHPYFYLGISILVCIVVGYLASLFFPAPTRSLAGLTILEEKSPLEEKAARG